MTKFEFDHRQELERDAQEEERRNRDREPKNRVHMARIELESWDEGIIQIIPAPPGMVVRRMGEGEKGEPEPFESVVVALGLQRNGRVVPIEIDFEYGMVPSSSSLLAGTEPTILVDGKEQARGHRVVSGEM